MCVPIHVCPILCLISLRQSVPAHIYVPEISGHCCVAWNWLLALSSVPSVTADEGLPCCKHYAHVPLQHWQSLAVSEIINQAFSRASAAKNYFKCDSFQETRGGQNLTEFLKLNILLMHSDTVKHSCSVLSSYAERTSVTYMYPCADFYSILEDFVHRCLLCGAESFLRGQYLLR